MDRFETKIYEYVMSHHMIESGGHVTAGVSRRRFHVPSFCAFKNEKK